MLISLQQVPFRRTCLYRKLPSNGIFYTCLFSSRGVNLLPLVRHDQDPDALKRRIHDIWTARTDRYSEERGRPGSSREKVEMYRLGG